MEKKVCGNKSPLNPWSKDQSIKNLWDGWERSLITGVDPAFVGPKVYIILCSLLKKNTKLGRRRYERGALNSFLSCKVNHPQTAPGAGDLEGWRKCNEEKFGALWHIKLWVSATLKNYNFYHIWAFISRRVKLDLAK